MMTKDSSQSDVGRAEGRLTFVLGKVGGNRMERATGHGGVLFLFLLPWDWQDWE